MIEGQQRIRFRKQVLSGAIKVPHITDERKAEVLRGDTLVSVSRNCWLCNRRIKRYYIYAQDLQRIFLAQCQGGCL